MAYHFAGILKAVYPAEFDVELEVGRSHDRDSFRVRLRALGGSWKEVWVPMLDVLLAPTNESLDHMNEIMAELDEELALYDPEWGREHGLVE